MKSVARLWAWGLLIFVCGVCLAGALILAQRRGKLSRPLRAAVLNGDQARVHALLAQGADPNCWPDGRSFWSRLLDGLDPRFHRHRPPHMTLLLRALREAQGGTEIACDLLDHGATVTDGPELCFAVHTWESDDLPFRHRLVQALLDRGANPNARNELVADTDPAYDEFPLSWAVGGDNEDVPLLLAHGADVNAKDRWGMTPLMEAAKDGQLGAVKMLLAHGADVRLNTSHSGDLTVPTDAVEEAIDAGHPDVVRTLLDHGVDVNERGAEGYPDSNGATLLMDAANSEQYPVMTLLLSRGADPNLKDDHGKTALDWAPAGSRAEMAKLFRLARRPAQRTRK